VNGKENGHTRAGLARVVLVEDHEVLREGLGLLLRRRGFDVVAEVGTAGEGAETISRVKPEVSVIDVALPGESGIELARRLLRADGSLGILMYTGTADRVLLRDALDCGARGFVVKGSPPATFMSAVHAVAAGGSYFDPVVHSMLLSREVTDDLPALSVREREILDLLARGLTGEAAAARLHLSPETVRTHVRNAMRKLQAQTRTHAIVLALQQEQIRLGEPVASPSP
jgi:DNA-binding NarL/FixJ family response regulator